MDFRTLAITAEATSRQATEALLLVIVGDRLPASLDAPLQQAVKDAVALGDFAYKPAQVAYLRQVAGVKAARVTVVAAKDGSAKAVRAAALAGIGQIKGLGVKQVAVLIAGADAVSAAHAEAVASAAAESVYTYRTTKPSAPAASALSKLTLLVAKADQKAADAGLAVGAAIADGVDLARELAISYSNV